MPDVAEKLNYRIRFDQSKMTEDQRNAIGEASRALNRAGVLFDEGSEGALVAVRIWEWDWSLKGPVTIESRIQSSHQPLQDQAADPA